MSTPTVGFRCFELTEVPRTRSDDREIADNQQRSQSGQIDPALFSALIGAHATLLAADDPAGALLIAWVRPPNSARIRLIVGSRDASPLVSSEFEDPASGLRRQRMLIPPGAVATDLGTDDGALLFEPFSSWIACVARSDVLWVPSTSSADVARRGSFDQLVAHLHHPFVWLVRAEPLRPAQVQPELDTLNREILPLSRAEVGEANRVALERAKSRHRELSRAQDGSAWRISVVAGGVEPVTTRATASILSAGTELQGLPYALTPAAGDARDRDQLFVAGTELLAALARPPAHELPGVRVVDPSRFDVTPEIGAGDGLALGAVLDELSAEVGGLELSRSTLNRHTLVCGATGSGKSMTVRHLLTEATRNDLPWLVIEPAKAEYRRMANRLSTLGRGDVITLRPGDIAAPAAGFNPLEPAPGFTLQTHADMLKALFVASFRSVDPFPQIVAAAITRSYEAFGWDLTLGSAPGRADTAQYPMLSDLQRVAERVVADIGYGSEVSADMHGFIKVRLESLRLGTTGRFFEGGHRLNFGELLQRNVVIEIQDVGDDADKAFLMGAMLIRLVETLRVDAMDQDVDPPLRHLTVIEEAHRLLREVEDREAGGTGQAVEMFASILAEVRAYGEGLIVAEQIPSKLISDVIKNTAAKIVHRLPAQDDREAVGATMNLDKMQATRVVSLTPGEAAVFTDGMDRPMLIRVPDGRAAERAPNPRFGSVTDLITVRSATCGVECRRDRPCLLEEMRAARQLLVDQPWLVVWAELTVLGHLLGNPAPSVVADQLRMLTAPERTVACAVSHAVDAAVASRTGELRRGDDPQQLAEHCVAVLRSQLAGQGPGATCDPDEFGYLARIYQWYPVLSALSGTDGNGRHAQSADWERAFGRRIPGTTADQQRAVVTDWWTADISDRFARDAVTFGALRPSALEVAVGAAAGTDRWRLLLSSALEPYVFAADVWPVDYLIEPAE